MSSICVYMCVGFSGFRNPLLWFFSYVFFLITPSKNVYVEILYFWEKTWNVSHLIISDHIWSYLIISDHIWSYLIISDHIWSYLIISDHIWSYLIISDHIWSYLIIFTYNYECIFTLDLVMTQQQNLKLSQVFFSLHSYHVWMHLQRCYQKFPLPLKKFKKNFFKFVYRHIDLSLFKFSKPNEFVTLKRQYRHDQSRLSTGHGIGVVD